MGANLGPVSFEPILIPLAGFTCGVIVSGLIASTIWSLTKLPETLPQHFILHHSDELDPDALRSMLADQHSSYEKCDIYDLRSIDTSSNHESVVTRDQAVMSLIKLRHVDPNWIPHKRSVVLLPSEVTDNLEVCLAQMRAVGLLAVIVVPAPQEAEEFLKLSLNLDQTVRTLPL